MIDLSFGAWIGLDKLLTHFKRTLVARSYLQIGLKVLAATALFLIGAIRLESMPPLWWDEGWTLCVARNWVTLGHYGCLLADQPASPILAARFPVVAPIALSFHFLGIGIWQARLVGLLFSLGAMWLLYRLTVKLFNLHIAVAGLMIVLLLPVKWQIHPLFIGRQVLGEMSALVYLLAGYLCFFYTLRKSWRFLPLVVCFWGLALMAKLQVEPFWVISVGLPLGILLLKRQWRLAGLLTAAGLGSWGMYQVFTWGQQWLLRGHTVPGSTVDGLHEVLGLVFVPSVRLAALRFALIFGLPTLLGLAYAFWQEFRWQQHSKLEARQVVRLMLLAAVGSWLGWFTGLSVGWDRYAFPALFLATPFVAALLYNLTDGFNFSLALSRNLSFFKTRQFDAPKLKAAAAILLLSLMILLAARSFYLLYQSASDTSVLQVAQFINTTTPDSALIETYDSELFFLLERPYHYPPAQLHVDLIRRAFLAPQTLVAYDPAAANPDYLVTGPFSTWVRLYEPFLASGDYHLVQTFGPYQVYERRH